MIGEDPPSNVPPAAFGRFRVLHQIGAGSLGPVFRAEDPASQTSVVIKVLRLNLTPERARIVADELATFQDRVPAHPGIAPIVKAGIRDVEPYVVSAFMSGDSLDVALRDAEPVRIVAALPRLVQLAAGLDFCADASIWHGGLHPRDVLVSAAETAVVGVGIAPILERAGVRLPVRRPYTAPEVVDGLLTTSAADQFALAAMVFEWLYGQRIAGPAEGRIEVPELAGVDRVAMADAFTSALAMDPAVRFESSSAFVAALAGAVEKPETAPRPRATRTSPRRSRPVPLTSIVPPLPGSSAAFDVAQDRPEGRGGTQQPLWGGLPSEPRRTSALSGPHENGPGGHDVLIGRPPSTLPDLQIAEARHDDRGGEQYRAAAPLGAPRFRMTWMHVAAAIVAAIAIGGGAGYWFANPTAVETGDATVDVTRNASGASAATQEAPAQPDASLAIDKRDETQVPTPVPPNLAPGAVAAIDAAASLEHPGRVLIRSTPAGADVVVNGLRRGLTPLALRDLPLGPYLISVSLAGYSGEQQQVTLTANRPSQSLEISLVGGPGVFRGHTSGGTITSSTISTPGATIGSLMIESRPVGAKVFIDGRAAGITPIMLERLRPGPHAVRLERTGYQSWTIAVSVVEGELTRLAASLAGGQEEE